MATKKILRVSGKIALGVIGLVVAYALIGTILSIIPVNLKVAPGNDVTIYLDNNGVHTDIVVPSRSARFDWTSIVRPDDTSAKTTGAYLAFGWGSQDFYLNVPEWRDLTLGVALRAISGAGGTALHTTYVREPVVNPECCRISMSFSQYDALVQYILSSGRRGEHGAFVRIDHPGYGRADAFYVGTGHYSPFFTCNTWANSALKSCGQKCCLWTALQQPIFWKYRHEGE